MKEFFNDLREGMSFFSSRLNIIINSILLSFVYFFSIGLTKLFAKIVKKDFLDIKVTNKRDTYWSELNLKNKTRNDYFRQF